MGPINSPDQRKQEDISSEVKWSECEDEYSPAFNAKVNTVWGYTSSPLCFHGLHISPIAVFGTSQIILTKQTAQQIFLQVELASLSLMV